MSQSSRLSETTKQSQSKDFASQNASQISENQNTNEGYHFVSQSLTVNKDCDHQGGSRHDGRVDGKES